MKILTALALLCSIGCGSADGSPPIHPVEASPEPQHEAYDVCEPAASDDFVAWQSEGLTHVSQRRGNVVIVQHYDRETPFEVEFQGLDVIVSNELDVCVIQ